MKKINKTFAQTYARRVSGVARTDIVESYGCAYDILYGSYARGKYVIWNNTQTDILPKQEERRYAKTFINE